eukprot:8528261-Pyramimonas_sp.AAC.1
MEVVRAESLKRIFSDYKAWAKKERIDVSYQLAQLTPSMIQGKKKPELKTKAAETGVLLRWATHYCNEPGGLAFPGRATFAAAG